MVQSLPRYMVSVDAARVRKLAGIRQIARRIETRQLLRSVMRLDRHPADRGELLLSDRHVHILANQPLRPRINALASKIVACQQ